MSRIQLTDRAFSDDLLQHVSVQGQIGHQLLEPPILLFQLPQPPQLGDPHPSELALPTGEGLLAHPQLTADLRPGIPDSAWRKAYAICSSVKVDVRIWSPPHE